MERFACPSADRMGRYHCIDDHALCDGFIDCPTGEDEDRQACMFYKTVSVSIFLTSYTIINNKISCETLHTYTLSLYFLLYHKVKTRRILLLISL